MFSQNDFDTIKSRTLNNITFDIDKREGSIINDFASANAMSLAKAYIDMGDIMSIGFIEDTFDSFLDKRVGEFGVYRKQGQKAQGVIQVSGDTGLVIEEGTILTCNDLNFILLNEVSLPEQNLAYVEAEKVGYKYNLLANSNFVYSNMPSTVHKLTNEKDFTSGIDEETDKELRERFKKVVNNPSTSGNKAHYESWALEVNGVGRAIVYPLWNGNGTVKVMIIGNDGKPVSHETLQNTIKHIEEEKPIGCAVTIVTPSILNVNITSNVKLYENYTLEEVQLQFTQRVEEYLKTVDDEIVYTKIFGILATMQGVLDFDNLLINGLSRNIAVQEDKIPSVQKVQLTEVM